MNDEYLKKLYSYLGAQDSEYHKRTTYDDFKSKMGSEDYSTKVHSYIKGIDSEFRSLEDFNSKIKKKSDWGSTLGSGSLELQKPEDYTYGDSKSAYRKQGNQWLISNESTKGNYVAIKDPTGSRAKELEKNAVKKDNKFISKETKKEYQLEDNNFSEVNPEKQKALRELNAMKYAPPKPGPMGHGSMPAFSAEAIKIKEDEYNNIPSRINLEDDDKIKALNKQFGKNASLDADYETFGDYDNSSEKKNNKYRIKNNSWERWVPGATAWSPISNEGSISALNRRYGKNIEAKKAIVVKPKEIDPFLKVNSNFLAQSEESAQEMLEKNFKGMGFAFEQVGAGDYIKVTPNNGVPSQTFSFKTAKSTNGAFSSPTGMGGFNDNSKENIDQAVKLQSYLRLNASAEKEDDLSAVNIIKNNTSRGKAAYVDPNNFIENNKYYESEDYKNAFKELTFQQKKNEIREREREAVNLSIADGDGWLMESINEYIFGDTPNAKARKERLLKAKQTLYKSEEYKLYYNEQKKYDEQQGEKYDKLYDEYVIVKQSGNKEDIKTVKAKIEGGYSKELIGDNLTHMTGSQYDLQRNINNFNKRKEKLELDAKNGNLTQEQYNDAVEDLSSEAQRLDIAAKNVAATQKKMNALAGVYVTEKAKSGGFFGNFTNALVVGMDEVREPLSYIFPLIGKDLSGDEARKISLDSKIITPQQRQYYKDKGFTDEQIKNVLLNNVQKNAIAANKRAIIETFGSDLTTEESKQNLGFFEQALVGVAASLPSMLTRAVPIVGAPLAFASMANMSYNAINEEMLNDTDFETTSEAERAVVAVPYALVMGALENIGLKYMTSGKSTLLAKSILSAVAKVLPAKAGREVAEKVINKEVKSLVGKGAIKIVNGTLVEGETGFYQAALLDVGLKSLFNVLDPLDLKLTNKEGLTGGEAFTTPDTKMGVAGAILEGAAAEAIGGFAMSTVMTGAQGLINGKISLYNKEDLKFFEDFSSDQEFKKLIVSKLKTEMLNGTMTKGEAQSALNDIDLVEGVFNSIDENISDEAKIIAFNLINERNRLEKEVIGKDPALSKEKNDRIKDINNKLGTLPLQVLVVNNIERATKLENALKQKGAVIIDGETINRKAAQTELDKINQKVIDAKRKQEEDAIKASIPEEISSLEDDEVKVLAVETLEEIPEQFRDRAQLSPLTEVETREKIFGLPIGKKGSKLIGGGYTYTLTGKEAKDYAIQEQTAGQVPVQPTTTVGEEVVQGEPTTEPQVLTEEGKTEEVAPQTLLEELQLIEEEKAKADIEKRRQDDLSQVIQTTPIEIVDEKGNVIQTTDQKAAINAKYDAEYLDAVKKGEMTKEQAMKALEDVGRKDSKAYAELAALEAPIVEVEATSQEKVATYRAEEQAELLKAIPKIESYKVNGKIKKNLMPKTVLAKYNKIYEKYDKLISPLLEPVVKAKAPVVKAPVVKAQAPKAKGKPTVMSWSKVEEYDDAVIRSMKEIQYGKLKPLLALGKRTTVAQKTQIEEIKAKISIAEKILNKRANKIKNEAQRVEKEGKGATVRAVDNNGTEAEYSVVVSKDGATAKVQLKKIGTLTPKRASAEANLTIETDEKRGRFVITKNKTKVYIDEAITTAKVEPTKAKVETDKLNSEEKQYALESGIPEEDAIPTRSIFKKVISRTGITVERVKQLIKSNKYTEKKVKVDEISPSQLVIERDLISKIENKDNLPIIGQLGNEFIVLDGHHRISTYIRNGAKTINAKVIDLSTIQPKAEPVKAEAPAPAKESTDDLMGAIDSIKEDIEDTTKEIEDTRKVAREKINKIREEILDLKESKGKEGTIMDLEADIKEIEDILKEDLDGLKLDLDRHVQALKEEVKKLEDLDAKAPENKKTLLSYLDAAIATLNGLNKLTYAGIGVGTSLATLKLILKGIRAGVIAGNTINASIKAMASQYRGKHKNKKITIAEFTKEIEEYLRNTFVDQKTNEQDIQEARDKFVEIREAVRKAKVAVKTESKVLRANAENAIREMLKGKVKNLSAVQMKSIMLRLARFNVFSQTQYDKFIDYVDKVIGIADYDAKVNEANKNRKNAKKNTIGDKPKLGDITPDLFRSLSIMLNIDAKLIPSDVFESYYKIVDMLSKRDTVLQLEQRSFLNENVDKIIASIELNDEKISDLKELYDNFEKIKEDGKVDYSGTLAKMLKDDVINQDEYELMKTFKSKIVEAKVKDKMTEQEIADEKAELIDEVNNTTITLNEIVGDEFRLERELAKRLQVLLKQTDLKNLNNKDLKKLLIIIDNINNGFVSNATQLMVEKLNSTKKSIPLATSVHAKITSLYNKMNRFISKTFSRDEFRIAVAPLNLIDEQFGDFQTKNIYNSVFKDSAKAQQAFEAEISKIRAELTEIEKSLDKFFDKDHNKKVASKIKMMIYMLQIEKNSNPNSNKVHNAIDILDATIKFSKENSKKSKNSKADLKVLESIRENFVKDEQIDMDELFNSFGAQEKNALKKLQEINNSMTKKAAYTATVINGNKITTFDNYIFHNTISASDDMSVDALVNNISDNMQPTTKSKNLEERGDKALAMNLNPFLAVTVSSRSVLLNYHLTEPIRTARKTLIDTIKLLDAEKANGEKNKMTSEERKDFEAATKEQYDILNAIKDAYETATKDLLTSNFTESKQWIEWFSKQGYRAVLASAPRAVAELTSNGLFVLSAFPKEITIGFNNTFSLSNSSDAKNILESLGSSLISRIYPEDSLSSVWLDTSAFSNRISRDGKMKPKMVNGVLKFHDKYTGRWVDAVSFMADNLIAKPDQAIMRPLWFGSFVNSFKNKTGVEPDFNKIKENDEAYMDEYRDALEEARDVADNNADLTGGNMNPYMSSLQNVIRKEDSFPKVWLKTFQKYMNKFTVKEYYTARKGVRALVGDGDITQKQGALILTGVALRMTMYTTVTRLLSEFIMYSFGLGDDDDEEDDDYNAKHIGRKLYQGFTSMLTTLILGRRFGNVVRMAENYFIEWANETYGEDIGLRNGEYDPYEDAVQFNQLQDGKIDKTTDLVKVIAGPYAPAVGFSDLVIKKARELRAPEAKTERARITKAKEWGRLGLETTGFLGIMPLYKDVRKVFMGYTYKELKKETKETAVKKEAKAKTDAEEISQKTISLKEMMNSGEYTREGIKKELRKIKDPEYRKALKDKDDAIRKKILDKYGYENLTDFKRNDEDNYEIEFGDDSPYRIERAESAKIANELEKRLNALEDGEEYYPTDGAAIVVPKKKVNKYNRYKSVQNNNLPDFYSKSYKKY